MSYIVDNIIESTFYQYFRSVEVAIIKLIIIEVVKTILIQIHPYISVIPPINLTFSADKYGIVFYKDTNT